MHVQAVVFSAAHWSPALARAWLASHNYAPIKRVHRTASSLRYRLSEPVPGAAYYTKKLPNHVSLVLVR